MGYKQVKIKLIYDEIGTITWKMGLEERNCTQNSLTIFERKGQQILKKWSKNEIIEENLIWACKHRSSWAYTESHGCSILSHNTVLPMQQMPYAYNRNFVHMDANPHDPSSFQDAICLFLDQHPASCFQQSHMLLDSSSHHLAFRGRVPCNMEPLLGWQITTWLAKKK